MDNDSQNASESQEPEIVESPLAPYLRLIGIQMKTGTKPAAATAESEGAEPGTETNTPRGKGKAPAEKAAQESGVSLPDLLAKIGINIKPKKKKRKTLRQKKREKYMYIVGGIFALIGLVIWWGMQPITGTMYYGVCKVFAEQQLAYPHTMGVSSSDQYANKVRIFYTSFDPFGEYKIDRVECTFAENPQGGISYFLKSARVNKVSIDKEVIRRFNGSVPAILANPPDLILPPVPGENLEDLRRHQ